jgi:hypothetical protein
MVKVFQPLWQIWQQVDFVHIFYVGTQRRKWAPWALWQTFFVLSFTLLARWYIGSSSRCARVKFEVGLYIGLGLDLSIAPASATWLLLLVRWREKLWLLLFSVTHPLKIFELIHEILDDGLFWPNSVRLRNICLLTIVKPSTLIFVHFFNSPIGSIYVWSLHHGIPMLVSLVLEVLVLRWLDAGLPVLL